MRKGEYLHPRGGEWRRPRKKFCAYCGAKLRLRRCPNRSPRSLGALLAQK